MARKRKPASKKSGGSSVIGIIIVCAVPMAIYLGLPKDAQEAVKDKASKTMAKVKEGASQSAEETDEELAFKIAKARTKEMAARAARRGFKRPKGYYEDVLEQQLIKARREVDAASRVNRIAKELGCNGKQAGRVAARYSEIAGIGGPVLDEEIRESLIKEKKAAAAAARVDGF